MFNRNQLTLLVITLVTLALSGYLIYSGINYQKIFFQNEQKLQVKETKSSASPQVLGSDLEESALNEYQQAKVTKVVDGDTIEVEIDNQRYKLRYIGIN